MTTEIPGLLIVWGTFVVLVYLTLRLRCTCGGQGTLMGPARRAAARFALYVAGFVLLYAAFLGHEALYRPGSVGSLLVAAAAVTGLFLVHEGFHFGHQNQE